jgi:DNA gyrase subunit A
MLVDEGDDILLISRHGMSLRFTATDEALRPMGRSTEGVKGMSFRANDSLLSASVAQGDGFVFVVTEGGYAKRTDVAQYRGQSRGGLGIKVAKLSDERGVLAGGLIVSEDDEVLVVLSSGKVVRSAVAEVPAKGRDTMGVVFARMTGDDRILAVARNSERGIDEEDETDAENSESQTPESSTAEAEKPEALNPEAQAPEAESPEES